MYRMSNQDTWNW